MAPGNAGRRSFLSVAFRASSEYELILLDRLTGEEQATLSELRCDPTVYGVLRSEAGGSLKVANRDLALLLLTLREPGPLPFFAYRDRAPDVVERELATLLLDGVLEIVDAGRTLRGRRALARLGWRKEAPISPTTTLGRRSRDALRYAEALTLDDYEVLSERLYGYGRIPKSPRWRRLLGGPREVLELLGDPELKGWRRLRFSASSAWIAWRAEGLPADHRPAQAAVFKLYVSPRVEDIRKIFAALPEVLARSNASQVKVGGRADSLLRPDKLLIYFDSKEGLFEASDILEAQFRGLPVHGVPFTAEAGGDGLLSWGLDPPESERLLSWRYRGSWRSWVTDRLAGALLEARHQEPEGSVIDLVLEKLRLEGVDTGGWTPSRALWGERAGAEVGD